MHRNNLINTKLDFDSYAKLFLSLNMNILKIEQNGSYQAIRNHNDHFFLKSSSTCLNVWDDINDELLDETWRAYRLANLSGTVIDREFPISHFELDDEQIWVKLIVVSVKSSTLLVYKDISEQKKDLAKLVADERLATIGILAGGLAHQYNNLHHAILGKVHETKALATSKKVKARLNAISSMLEQGAELSNSLLGQIRKGDDSLVNTKVSQVMDRVKLLVKDELLKLNCTLKVEDTDVSILCRPSAMDQVLVNLILNGAHACCESENERVVRILVSKDNINDKVRIQINDNGTGIEKKDLTKLFTPLFSTKGVYAKKNSRLASIKGTGLGLSLAKQLIEDQNGTIELKTSSSNGTTFEISMPLIESTTAVKILSEEPVSHTLNEKKRIYIADDSKENLNILKVYLSDYASSFSEHHDGEVNKKEFLAFDPEVIFVDWMMPNFNGGDFLKFLQDDADLKKYLKRAVIFSGIDSSEEIDSWRSKISQVLLKPLPQQKLVEAIKKLHA